MVVADSVNIGGSRRLPLEVFLCFFCLLAGTMPHAPPMRRVPVSDATRLGDSDLESGEIPDSDLECDYGIDLSSLTVAALGNASFGSLASRMAARSSGPVEGGMICNTDQGCVYPEDVMSCKRCACIYYVVSIRCCLRVNIIDFPGHLFCPKFDAADSGAACSSAEIAAIESCYPGEMEEGALRADNKT